MCRIAGIWNKSTSLEPPEVCVSMRDTLAHGGPDDCGLYIDEQSRLALGHRRLSVIDLSGTGHQPMSTPEGRYTICYNGEVYNYRELRRELEGMGAVFRGASDTEVVLHAFAAWGPACVERFIGMFAFALWDNLGKRLFLFRDRMGVKPLYYFQDQETFAFASELKAIHAGLKGRLFIDQESLGEFFHYGYIAGSRTIYRNVSKLEPGCWIRVDGSGTLEKHCYWSAEKLPRWGLEHISEEILLDRLQELLADAFTKRLIADVPVGVFLSGGIDSSLVTAVLSRHTDAPVKTFTIGFREKDYDESPWAQRVADHLGTEHTCETLTPEHAREVLSEWPEIYDEPFGDISGIPTAIVSKMTRNHVKVSLSADGGDELFCGYPRYALMERLHRYISPFPRAVPRMAGTLMEFMGSDLSSRVAAVFPNLRQAAIKDRLRKMQAVLAHWQGDATGAYRYAIGYWLPEEVGMLMGSEYRDPRAPLGSFSGNLMESMMLWDMSYYLSEDILTKVDRATMSVGLEGRDPLLDHRIVEFSLKLPLEFKRREGVSKYLLRRMLGRYLPESLFDRPKQGFAVPIYAWMHDDLMHLVDEYLNPDTLSSQGEIDPGATLQTIEHFKREKGRVGVDRIWLLLVYMMWRRRYIG